MAYLTDWRLEPPLFAIAVAVFLYMLGMRKRVSRRRGPRTEAALFAAGLIALVLAYDSPLAALDDELFWVHMTQHMLLFAVAPPLILLGRPWATIARSLPVGVRRRITFGLVRGTWSAPLRGAARRLTGPTSALVLFLGTLVAWHLPALYDATLDSFAIHELEHALFLAAGLLYWSQLIDSPPFRSRLGFLQRALYATAGMAICSALGLVLAFAPSPLYPGYADLASRPGGISALADQHLAGGVMWVPGSISFTVAIVIFAYRWLDETAQDGRRHASALAGKR
ncbi:MAG: cytochrome c oxidase assembly protein [Actinomycetota bacterium]|nr:cytochrome c oxidase assembly protein [Actinomycetota bacterium]